MERLKMSPLFYLGILLLFLLLIMFPFQNLFLLLTNGIFKILISNHILLLLFLLHLILNLLILHLLYNVLWPNCFLLLIIRIQNYLVWINFQMDLHVLNPWFLVLNPLTLLLVHIDLLLLHCNIHLFFLIVNLILLNMFLLGRYHVHLILPPKIWHRSNYHINLLRYVLFLSFIIFATVFLK